MKTLKTFEFKTFESLATLSQGSLKKVMSAFLKKRYKNCIETDRYILAEGDIPIALVAHLDTVFESPPKEVFFDQVKNVIFSPQGLGADDRAGIFSIVQIINANFHPHIILTTDEEIGGYGAAAVSLLECPFKDLKYIIELDRRGGNDCVFYDCDNEEFINYIESFGFEWNFGSYTDICEFCPAWKIAGVNLSVGYRDEHTVSEILFVGHMLSTIEKVKKMLLKADKLKEPFKYIPSAKYKFAYGIDWYKAPAEVVKCDYCKKYFIEEEMFPIVRQNKETGYCCGSCVDKVGWCTECGNAYEKVSLEAPNTGYCPDCEEKKSGT